MLRWIRSSSRVEIFIFLNDWGIFFGRWELDLQRRASSSSQSLLKVITSFWHTFFTWMNPMILGGYSRWPSQLLHSSLLLLPLQFVLYLRYCYDCMVSALRIFTFFNWFLKVIFWFLFFPSNSLVKESKHLWCLWGRHLWYKTESTMIFLALTKFFLWKASNLISLWKWNLCTHVGVQSILLRGIIYFHAWKLSSWSDISLLNENLKWK